MQIHQIKIKKRKCRKRIGRGGRRGTYSGRGNKGQKARSGGNVNPLFEGGRSSLIERLKKVRGFKSRNAKKTNINLGDLEKLPSDTEINAKNLVEEKLISKAEAKNGIKILGDGKITKKFKIGKGILLSKSAKSAIEKAGGTLVS